MLTCLFNLDTLESPFYIVKLVFKGVYIMFLIFAPKYTVDYGFSFTSPNIIRKNIAIFLSEIGHLYSLLNYSIYIVYAC